MTKIVWISASLFGPDEETQSGVWQKSLALQLAEVGGIELYNVSYQRKTPHLLEAEHAGIKQWGLPYSGLKKKGLPPPVVRSQFEKLMSEINPDIIHVWGTENPLGKLPFLVHLPALKVLSMQGVMASIVGCIYSGLSLSDIVSTLGIRELIRRNSLMHIRRDFAKASVLEEEMIGLSDAIIIQSEWTGSQVRAVNSYVPLFRIHRVLRSSFLHASKWIQHSHTSKIIYSAAVGYSLKGLHVLIKALEIVAKEHPDVELRLAGLIGRTDWLGDGYLRLIIRMIRSKGLENNVRWMGPLTAGQIVDQLQQASVFVQPSYVESYSLVLAEAMAVGTPSVVAYAGAMPELADNNEALFFTPGDYKRCAAHISHLLSDEQLAYKLSFAANQKAESRNRERDTARVQLDIYRQLISTVM